MFRSIISKFYVVTILLIILFVAGYSILNYFLQQQSQSVSLARDSLLIERNISTLNQLLLETRHWERGVLTKENAGADLKFAELLEKIRNILAELNNQELNRSTKSTLSHISKSIEEYERLFNETVQRKTRQRLQKTRMETNYRSLTSSILNRNVPSLLKPLFNFSHFYVSFDRNRDASSYQALRLVIESLEKKIIATQDTDLRALDYIENFSEFIDNNYNMELELLGLNREVERIHKKLQDNFTKISSESKAVIRQKLKEAVEIKSELKNILLFSTYLGAILLLLILRYVLTSIFSPLRSLSHVMQKVKGGAIEARFVGNTEKEDEIVQLGLSFNEMLNTLGEKNLELLEYQEELEEKIKELSHREKERKKLTAKIQRIEKMEAIGALAGGVAHDLNNILSGVVSYPDLLLLELPEDSPYKKPIQTIQESGKKAAAIVQDLLTLARRGITVTVVTNINTLISEYLTSPEYKKLISLYPSVAIKTDLSTDLYNISGSPVHLNKTIMNLVLNGAESIPTSGAINIVTRNLRVTEPIKGNEEIEEGDYVVLSVSDSGTGISAVDIGKIFEPFYSRKEMGRSGTGLGLAVVWGTVEDHNGYIEVQSVEGDGTTFTLYLPATTKDVPASTPSITIEEYMGNGESVLIVDDTDSQREILSGMLQKLGYTVSTVTSGENAIEYLKKKPIDLLILDMIMVPGIDGLETYLGALQINPNQKAIITSGFSETDRVKEAQKAGAMIYIRKPYTMEKIGLAIKEEMSR